MDPMNPGMPGGGMLPSPASPGQGGPVSPAGGPPPPMGGPASPDGGQGGPGDPHDKIMEALKRIEDKLAVIAAKLGA